MAWHDPAIAGALRTAWDYMRLVHPAEPADAILTLGSFDSRAAIHAAHLWHAGLAPVVIMSGGIAHRGGLLDTGWDQSEAEVFAGIAMAEGVPPSAIVLEDEARNTGDNFTFTRAIVERSGLHIRTLLVVAKPYMTRRGYATGAKVWPQIDLLMQCEEIDLDDYFKREADPERTLQALVGDLHRLIVYPRLGFQIEQPLPAAVIDALKRLAAAGYDRRLLEGYGTD